MGVGWLTLGWLASLDIISWGWDGSAQVRRALLSTVLLLCTMAIHMGPL